MKIGLEMKNYNMTLIERLQKYLLYHQAKEKGIYNKLIEEKFEKINNLDKKVDINKLVFKYKDKTADEDFNNFDNAHDFIDKKISLNYAQDDQTRLRSKLGETKRVQRKNH